MDFKQLQSLVAVVRYGSFTKAAEALCMSQPTVSAHIHAKVIRLGASTIPTAHILPEILPAYRKRVPEVRFILHQSDSQGIIDMLLRGALDIGLIGMDCRDETLVCVPFYSDRVVLITPVNEHFRALKEWKEMPLETLLREPVILREKGSGSLKSADRFFASVGVTEDMLRVTARVSDQESIKNLVASGVGISVVSERAAQNYVAEKRLLMFELPRPAAQRDLYVVYHGKYVFPNHVKEFVEYVKRYYAGS